MSSNDICPLVWHMDDPDVLAHRFCLPQELKEYTAVTVFPDQRGLAFLNSQEFFLDEPDNTYMLTGDRIDSVVQGYHIMQAGSTPVTAVNPQLTLFDIRVKDRQSDFIELRSGEGRLLLVIRIVLSCRLGDSKADLSRFLAHAGAFCPGKDGGQLRLSDIASGPAFTNAFAAVTGFLTGKAASLNSIPDAKAMLRNARENTALTNAVAAELAPWGIVLDGLHLHPIDALCPHCSEPLSLEDITRRRCTLCAGKLQSCPHCHALIGPHHDRCPVCRKNEELLFCESCDSYILPVRGRFCPTCHRACYPPRRSDH